MHTVPIPGTNWLHYKGGTYTVLVVAEHTETKELMVVYQHQGSLKLYTRPLSMWYDDVGDGRTRFTSAPQPWAWGGEGPMANRCIFTLTNEQEIWLIRPTPAP